jgi:GAF domain-containing protein
VRSYDPAIRFTDDDLRLLTLFGGQAAAAFVTAEAFERQRRAVESRVEGDAAHVAIHDHGMGIRPDALETVFAR